MSLSFQAALDHANRVYRGNRAEFDAVLLPKRLPLEFITTDGQTIPSFTKKRDPRFKWKQH